ncbi:hypothetical protein SteCoe_16424 [Stentor coeruleus]|uniref:G domain-containing protein n=1 Tax=Stentor coeruleus TaxID=5963 RepID=A0A1R2C1B5_9CILI|nr:hypothetical protein SteCoe_16424 [Stentor coeruleus]
MIIIFMIESNQSKENTQIKLSSNPTVSYSSIHTLSSHPSNVLKINGKEYKLPYGEKILVYNKNHSIKANIIFENNIIKKDITIITIGKNINFNNSSNINGKGLGVIFTKDQQKILIGEVKGLKGGSTNLTHSNEYIDLIETIKDNKNPHVSFDLKNLFKSIKLKNSFITYEKNINLPKDFQDNFIEFMYYLENNYIINEHLIQTIINNLLDAINDSIYWDFLHLILELYCIRKLKVTEGRKIIKAFIQDYKDQDIYKIITGFVSEKEIIDEFIMRQDEVYRKYEQLFQSNDNICDWDLFTWIICISQGKNKKKNSFFQLLNKDDKFFVGKFFTFTHPQTSKTIISDYIENIQRYHSNILISFSGSSLIKIQTVDSNIIITANINKEIGLSEYLQKIDSKINIKTENSLKESFQIIKISNNSLYIEIGEYQVQKFPDITKTKTKWVLLKSGEYRIQKYTLINDNSLYTIKMYYTTKSILPKKIKISSSKKKDFIQSIEELNQSIKVIDFTQFNITGTKKNLTDCLIVDCYEDVNQRKIQQLNLINEKLLSLRLSLVKNEEVRIWILMEYIKKGFIPLSQQIWLYIENDLNYKIKKTFDDLVIKYQEELEIKETSENLILKLALQANYETIVNKKESVAVKQTMDLLSESKFYTDEIKNKDLVLLLGTTGSGKSTTTCYLMKAEMKVYISKYGDEICEVVNNSGNYPKIGQSIGISETLYAKGYEIDITPRNQNSIKIMICDCPGFRDTRGMEYELCTNLSIDKAIKQASRIKGVVLTIQYTAFLQDRGQPVLESFQNLLDIVPDLIDDDDLLDSVFILITKVGDVRNIEEMIKERIGAHIHEIESLLQNKSGTYEASSSLLLKHRLWSRIQQIDRKKNLFIVKVRDKRANNNILNALYSSQPISKSKLKSAILSKELEKKYHDFIEMETHSWVKIIFEKFLNSIPKKIQDLNENISKMLNEIQQNENSINENLIKQHLLQTEIKKYFLKIELYENYTIKYLNNEISNIDIQNFLQTENHIFKTEKFADLTDTIAKLEKNVKNKAEELFSTQQQLKNSIEKLQNATIKVMQNEKMKKKLEVGSKTIQLWTYKEEANKKLIVFYTEAGAREKAISEVRDYYDYEITRKDVDLGYAKDYVGEIIHNIKLERQYRIVPNDNKDKFYHGSEVTSNYKTYKATIEGKYFEVDMQPKATIDGKKMIWPIKTTWNGNPTDMPWFKIYHTIPNMDINEATIINYNAETSNLNSDIAKLKDFIKRKQEEILEIDNEIQDIIKKINKCKIELDEEKNKEFTSGLEQLIEDTKYVIDCNKEKYRVLDKDIENFKLKNYELKEKIDEEKICVCKCCEERMLVGLAIYNQLGVLENLYEFCNSLNISKNIGESEVRYQTIESALGYMNIYKDSMPFITNEVYKVLGIEIE